MTGISGVASQKSTARALTVAFRLYQLGRFHRTVENLSLFAYQPTRST